MKTQHKKKQKQTPNVYSKPAVVELTENQKSAVGTIGKNICVSAGAGTGKTKVLVERFVHLIRENLASPVEILAITFTEKAANEMKRRIVDELKKSGLNEARRGIENAYIGTIHAFCSRILKEHPIEAGIDPEFRVIEEDEADLLKEAVLDTMIENRFQEPAVFDLLHYYSEENVRDGIKKIYDKIQMSNRPRADIFSVAPAEGEAGIKANLIEALQEIRKFKDKEDKANDAIAFVQSLKQHNWVNVENLKMISKNFDLRKKETKESSQKIKDVLEELIASEIEQLGAGYKETFQSLLKDFSEQYDAGKREKACFDFNDLVVQAVKLLGGDSPPSRALKEFYRRQFKFIMVDEFQDTDRLQAALAGLLQSGNNQLIVGDLKQSIYGFRGTDPRLLLEKEKEFTEQKTGIRIPLSENFRSSPELIQFINSFFEALWSDGEFSYEPLKPALLSATAAESVVADKSVDFLEIDRMEDETIDEARIREAKCIALRIQELVETKKYEFKDFALLFRAGTKMNLYEQAFRDLQVPYYVVSGSGFYHQPEVRDLLSFLAVIENPLQDIPLAAVLRSPLCQISDDALFWLSRRAKSEEKSAPLFGGFKAFDKIKELTEADQLKLFRFKTLFDELISKKEKRNVSQALEYIISQTQYDLYVLGMPHGRRHFANIRKLIDLAREREQREAIHLGDFIRYIKGLEAFEVRESEAQVEAEEGQVVRLLTIHKAKGLEFKCVILPDLIRGTDKRKTGFLFDDALGFGMKVPSPESGDFEKTLTYRKISDRLKSNETEESKRLLYVAMTRAKEKLILSSTTTSSSDHEKEDSEKWFDWVRSIIAGRNLPVSRLEVPGEGKIHHHRKLPLIEKKPVREKILAGKKIPLKKMPAEVTAAMERLKPLPAVLFDRIDLPVSAYLLFSKEKTHEEFMRVYELGAANKIETKNEELSQSDEEMVSSADFGTAIHRIYEYSLHHRTLAKGKLEEVVAFFTHDFDEQAKSDALKLAEVFISSSLYADVKKAKRFYAEIPFVLRLNYGVIQGTLDLLYETAEGDWVIADYKTSEIGLPEVQKTGESYRDQMELYALACTEILNIMPKKAALYFPKVDKIYDITFQPGDKGRLKAKFESLQKEIIEFRKKF